MSTGVPFTERTAAGHPKQPDSFHAPSLISNLPSGSFLRKESFHIKIPAGQPLPFIRTIPAAKTIIFHRQRSLQKNPRSFPPLRADFVNIGLQAASIRRHRPFPGGKKTGLARRNPTVSADCKVVGAGCKHGTEAAMWPGSCI